VLEKNIFEKDNKIGAREELGINVFPIKDKGFILMKSKGNGSGFYLVDLDFNLIKTLDREDITVPMGNPYEEPYRIHHFTGDSKDMMYLLFNFIDHNFMVSCVDSNLKIKRAKYKTNLQSITKTNVSPLIFKKIKDKYIFIVNYFDKSNTCVYKLYTINPQDMSVKEKVLDLPMTKYEVSQSYFIGNTTAGDDGRCLWMPDCVYKDHLIFIKAYYSDENKEDKKTIVKTIEMDLDGNFSAEYSYSFTNSTEERIRKRTIESEFDLENGQFYLHGQTGNINVSNIPGFFISKYKYRKDEIFTKAYNNKLLENKFNSKLVSDNMPRSYKFFDRFNNSLVIGVESKGKIYNKGANIDYYSFNTAGEIIEVDRRTFDDPKLEEVFINKKDPDLINKKKNMQDFQYSFASPGHWKDANFEFANLYSDAALNKKIVFCFILNRTRGDIIGYKLRR